MAYPLVVPSPVPFRGPYRRPTPPAPRYLEFIDGAKWDCKHCRGSGWRLDFLDYPERALVSCDCLEAEGPPAPENTPSALGAPPGGYLAGWRLAAVWAACVVFFVSAWAYALAQLCAGTP